ncbi:uncharacterized protein B0J16DRAFT_107011 [Fusarium flagelliforme]|uniref:Uncharacterized protein n=1 Tax=Fusarium flagelliforme TaxID=2675880 RepID=A0A395MDC6_9HYPO|nr:uncharacterized protein B0J16DRAFT_107011 [Fusarium flagelliforme]KAH7189055.1 hypothetical protein B0J16DRAFT_107011 [Fusarium flagelliforme]RFN45917.1 hypothetical protein FIE12Z_9839 [Fusarium flagelliforme]
MSLTVTQQLPQRELDAPKLDTSLAQRQSQSRPQIESLSVEPPIYSPSADADESSRENTPTTMMPTQRQLASAPALPAKSSLRASRCLDGLLTHKLTSEGQAPFSTPHDVYLSSEEDASSSADDFSDFETDSGSDESLASDRRGSREDTAKVVSVVYAGKPSVIDLPRRSVSPSLISEASSRPSSRMSVSSRPPSCLRRTSTLPVTLPVLDRRMSFCTTSSGSVLHPPRTSSMGTGRLEKQRPDFLSIDPFAAKPEPETKEESTERPKTPKSPGVFKRTLSLVKKRSRPSLNTHFASQSKDNLSLFTPTLPMEQVQEESGTDADDKAPRPILQKAPTYHEFAQRRMSSAPMSPMSPMSSEPQSPMTPNSTRSRLRQGLAAAARRRSVKV